MSSGDEPEVRSAVAMATGGKSTRLTLTGTLVEKVALVTEIITGTVVFWPLEVKMPLVVTPT